MMSYSAGGDFGRMTETQALSTLWLFPLLSSGCSTEPEPRSTKFYVTNTYIDAGDSVEETSF